MTARVIAALCTAMCRAAGNSVQLISGEVGFGPLLTVKLPKRAYSPKENAPSWNLRAATSMTPGASVMLKSPKFVACSSFVLAPTKAVASSPALAW